MVKPENLGKVCTLKICKSNFFVGEFISLIPCSPDPTTNFEIANPKFFHEYSNQ